MTEKTVKKLLANRPKNQFNMPKSKSKRKSNQDKKLQPKPQLKSPVIAITRGGSKGELPKENERKLVSDPIVKMELSKIPEIVIKKVKDAPKTPCTKPLAKKSKSAICSKRKISNSRKRNTIWTKFPPDEEVAPEVQKPKLSSVYQPGISYSDVVFSAGPCCSVKIKTLSTDIVTEPDPLHPPADFIENFPAPDRELYELPIAKSRKLKKSSRPFKAKVQKPLVKNLENDPFKMENGNLPIKDGIYVIKSKDDFLTKNVGTDLQSEKTEPLVKNIESTTIIVRNRSSQENFGNLNSMNENETDTIGEQMEPSSKKVRIDQIETDSLPKVENMNNLNSETNLIANIKKQYTLNVPYSSDTPLSSDENTNVSEPSESGSEANIGQLQNLFAPKMSLDQFPSTSAGLAKSSEIRGDFPWYWERIPRENERPGNTFFGIPYWNFESLYRGPEIYPRHSRQYTDESYLYAEDLANVGFKLARGK